MRCETCWRPSAFIFLSALFCGFAISNDTHAPYSSRPQSLAHTGGRPDFQNEFRFIGTGATSIQPLFDGKVTMYWSSVLRSVENWNWLPTCDNVIFSGSPCEGMSAGSSPETSRFALKGDASSRVPIARAMRGSCLHQKTSERLAPRTREVAKLIRPLYWHGLPSC